MVQTKNKIYLLKEGQKEISVAAQQDKSKMSLQQTILYERNKGHLKYYPGEIYDAIVINSVLQIFENANKGYQVNKFQVGFIVKYETFHDTFRFLIGHRVGDELKTNLVRLLASPCLSIKGTLTSTHLNGQPVDKKEEHEFSISEMSLKENQFYLVKDAQVLTRFCNKATSGVVFQLKYNITLEWKNSNLELPQKEVNVLQKMLNEKLFADCVIVAANDVEIDCHRSVLSAHSDVLHTMLKSEFQESQTGRIEMTDLAEETIKALILYLYENKMDAERITEEIAIELLNTSHKYNISSLERVMVKMLTSKPDTWFQIKNVLEIYFFTANVKEYETLCEQMVNILKKNSRALRATPTYQELEEKNPKAA